MAADVTKDDSVKALVDACVAKYGRVNILVKFGRAFLRILSLLY